MVLVINILVEKKRLIVEKVLSEFHIFDTKCLTSVRLNVLPLDILFSSSRFESKVLFHRILKLNGSHRIIQGRKLRPTEDLRGRETKSDVQLINGSL